MAVGFIKSLELDLIALYLRNSPLERGRWRLVSHAMPQANAHFRAHRWRKIRTRHGFEMNVDLGDWVGRHIYMLGDYEPGPAQRIRSILKPGEFFVDVGANIGFFTLLAASCVGERGKVIAFEPMPGVRRQLESNLALNDVRNVQVRSEAVSDSTGAHEFYAGPEGQDGCSSLRPLENASEVMRVATIRLDDVLPSDRRVSLLKLDVEGAELRAIRGFEARLRSDRPDLLVEITPSYLERLGDSAEELCDFLLGLGYRVYQADNEVLSECDPRTMLFPAQFNALFTSRRQDL